MHRLITGSAPRKWPANSLNAAFAEGVRLCHANFENLAVMVHACPRHFPGFAGASPLGRAVPVSARSVVAARHPLLLMLVTPAQALAELLGPIGISLPA